MATTAHDSHGHADHYTPGEMPIADQQATFTGVMGLFKWGSLAIAVSLILLTMWFCTPAGFLPALVVSLIVLILGVVFLRAKPQAAH
jgi:hypothetical protein